MGNTFISGRQKISTGTIIYGPGAAIVRIGIIINVLIIASRLLKNPFRGIRMMKRIREKRSSIQGIDRIGKYVKADGRYFFSENIPGWPSPAFKGFIETEVERVIKPSKPSSLSTVIFAITSRCRLGCSHCYEWNNISHTDRLTRENLKQIITKIRSYGVRHIQLSGGEPLERFDDLIELIQYSREGVDLWILTSGFGLTPAKAVALKKTGLTGADISLDHWKEEEHNSSRNNQESFYWVKEAVKNCRSAGIATSLSLCAFKSFVTEQNLLKYCELAKEWGVGFIRLLEPREAGRYKGKEIMLEKEQIDTLEMFFMKTNNSRKFRSYPFVTYPGYHQRRIGCLGAGHRYLYIDSIGDIHACPFCQRSAGNAVNDQLADAITILKTYGCQEYIMNLIQ